MAKRCKITRYLTIEGQFASGSFPDWICHRAKKLSLSGWVRPQGEALIHVLVCGDETLVDALEVACNLGPGDVLVDRIVQSPGNQDCMTGGFVRL